MIHTLDRVTITTDTWMKDPPYDHSGLEVEVEFWRLTDDGKHEFATFYKLSPKSLTRLVRLLVQSDEWIASADNIDAYYGERYDTASLTMQFNKKENSNA